MSRRNQEPVTTAAIVELRRQHYSIIAWCRVSDRRLSGAPEVGSAHAARN